MLDGFCGVDGFFGGVGHGVGGDDGHSGGGEDGFAFFGVGALQTDDEGDGEGGLTRGFDDSFGDDVAAHDAAEDVDEDGFDVAVGEHDLECGGDFFGGGAAADIKEVGGFAAV